MKRWIAVFGFILATSGVPASAVNLGGNTKVSMKDEIPYAPPFNWTGGYAGLRINYGSADTEVLLWPTRRLQSNLQLSSRWLPRLRTHRLQFPQTRRYLWPRGRYRPDRPQQDFNWFAGRYSQNIDRLNGFNSRASWIYERSQSFLRQGGWAFGDVTVRSEPHAVSYSDTLHGWTVGGGIERFLTNNMTARLEYRYTDLGNAAGLKDETDITMHAIPPE